MGVTFVLEKPNFGREGRSVLFKHFTKVLLGEAGRSVVEMEYFAGRLEPVLGSHVRIEKPVVFAVDVTLEGRRSVRQVVGHRDVCQKCLFGIAVVTAQIT